ncbi:hypothetical protein [Acetivibrio saccincola]|jgi:hypothetical protein|uniref:Uncharacterized protein n=1 Tax=Acetivibrio saccincola TaxID=1677857 RepID=A0A2K9DXZ8_9FIRM|nr:hypothetical protein [Acetivibrio saccincola]AUG56019.1 hypothetical protein HVS_00145 [Acetivibrio saccincola]PQQ65793.1 hypothetical protein B9R14_02755 [Acetivibrio saccincola]
MDYMKYKLIRESIRFIELCQMHVLENRMEIKMYDAMTNIKINFLKDMMEEEKTNTFLKGRFFNKINDLLRIDSFIHSCYCSKKANV